MGQRHSGHRRTRLLAGQNDLVLEFWRMVAPGTLRWSALHKCPLVFLVDTILTVQAGALKMPSPDAYSYVAERRDGALTPDDIHFLNFESGYTRFRICTSSQTVQSCQESLINGRGKIDQSTVDKFDYNGGHMQKHALLMGLGSLDNAGLSMAIRQGLKPLGSDWLFDYVQPQLAGGGSTSAHAYARFLRGILNGDLQMSKLLGLHPVCTNPSTCATAVHTPIPETESWHYAIGHWVEDDPSVGDHAYSSPGAFGFYPWIDADKRYYGILAREVHARVLGKDAAAKPAMGSIQCGRLIRAAWEDGQARP